MQKKQTIHTDSRHASKNSSISNTLKNLVVNKSLHSPYIQTGFNDKNKVKIDILSAYFVPLLKDINDPTMLLEWKINLNAALYLKNIYSNMSKPSD